MLDVSNGLETTRTAHGNLAADALALRNHFAVCRYALDAKRFQNVVAVVHVTLDRLGASLHDVNLTIDGILGPLNVHGPAVVLLDLYRHFRQFQDLFILQ